MTFGLNRLLTPAVLKSMQEYSYLLYFPALYGGGRPSLLVLYNYIVLAILLSSLNKIMRVGVQSKLIQIAPHSEILSVQCCHIFLTIALHITQVIKKDNY